MIKLASWNVNSLKVRLEQVLKWMEAKQIDILALQETKLEDSAFPKDIFTVNNYQVCYSGQKTYNGMAIISRLPFQNCVTDLPDFIDPQRRILAATIGNLRIINLYVPNGESLISDKYSYKLRWLEQMKAYLKMELDSHPHIAVVGDFNIAPEDRDVCSPIEWEGSVLVSPHEREAFRKFLDLGLKDSFRLFPQEEARYSWWDYRAASFRRNRGLRIDHILLNSSLEKSCLSSEIDKEPRKWERPSDHAPVWVVLDHELISC